MMQEAEDNADEIIEELKFIGHGDFSAFRQDIVELCDRLLDGNWDVSTTMGDKHLRLINEDEYDQHMDEDEDRPEDNLFLAAAAPAYVFLS